MATYWTLWFTHRSLVASERAANYVAFENAFPLADALLSLAVIGAAYCLWRARGGALLFGLLAGGGGFYLFAMDVLFDLEHRIWSKGAGGLVELAINLITVASSVALTSWLWRHRREIDPPTADLAGGAG